MLDEVVGRRSSVVGRGRWIMGSRRSSVVDEVVGRRSSVVGRQSWVVAWVVDRGRWVVWVVGRGMSWSGSWSVVVVAWSWWLVVVVAWSWWVVVVVGCGTWVVGSGRWSSMVDEVVGGRSSVVGGRSWVLGPWAVVGRSVVDEVVGRRSSIVGRGYGSWVVGRRS